jgi:hypothetical protein
LQYALSRKVARSERLKIGSCPLVKFDLHPWWRHPLPRDLASEYRGEKQWNRAMGCRIPKRLPKELQRSFDGALRKHQRSTKDREP